MDQPALRTLAVFDRARCSGRLSLGLLYYSVWWEGSNDHLLVYTVKPLEALANERSLNGCRTGIRLILLFSLGIAYEMVRNSRYVTR